MGKILSHIMQKSRLKANLKSSTVKRLRNWEFETSHSFLAVFLTRKVYLDPVPVIKEEALLKIDSSAALMNH